MTEQIIVNRRFCGPPDSGNGGYVCGLLSRYIHGDVEAKLVNPVPLDKPLGVIFEDKSRIRLQDDERVIAEAYPAEETGITVPEPPNYEEAARASADYIGFQNHVFPTCFVCGPQRKAEDGLRIFPGRIESRDLVATGWTPDKTLADSGGRVRNEYIWAALDCPGAFAVSSGKLSPIVLGTMSVRIEKDLAAGEKTVVIGWKISEEGRKVYAGTAIFSASGHLKATGRATWIRLK